MVSGYLTLKRKGNDYKACCPFHEEKTPSFHVHADRQFYKCFGCGVGGGVIDFVMRHEKVEFPAAIEILAEKAGIQLRKTGGDEEGPGRAEILRTLEWAAGFYRKQLTTASGGEEARAFLRNRGVSEETEEAWKLGWAPEGWDTLLKKSRREGIPEAHLAAAGLTVERQDGDGRYDRFRGRVMFPIFDGQGRTVAFGARTLKKDENPKFLNSPETALFSKGRQLFGLHAARDAAEESGALYIVEGYLDVIVPWQAGVRGLVATLGTSLTRDHLKVLKRHAKRVVLVFDSDAAGQRAAERGLDMLLGEDLDLFVAELPPGQDADDVIQKSGAQALKEVLERPKDVFTFLVDTLSSKIDTSTAQGKARLVTEVLTRIATVPDPIRQRFLARELSLRYGIPEGELISRLRREDRPAEAAPVAKPRTAGGVGRELIALLVGSPVLASRMRAEMPPERWPDEASASVARKAYEVIDRAGGVTASDLLALVREPEPMKALADALERPVNPKSVEKQFEACVEYLRNEEFRKDKAGVLRMDALVEARRGAPRNVRSLPRAR